MTDGIGVSSTALSTRLRLSCALACLACDGSSASIALAQRGLPPVPGAFPEQLQPIDEGIADRGSGAVSFRRIAVDQRQDTNFDHIYSAPGRPDLLMRRDGAITAIFPQSLYGVTKGGMIPMIPAGTLYFLGTPSCDDPCLPAPIAGPPTKSETPDRDARQNSTPVSSPIDARVSSATFKPTTRYPAPDGAEATMDSAAERARVQRLREIAERIGPR